MRLSVIIVLVLSLIWGIGSWKWYTCNIKGFCGDTLSTSSQVDADSDHDGLSNEDETHLGTDPNKSDSDGDGFSDRKEVGENISTPLDTDNDGVIDAIDEDDDNDGILTQYENLLATSAYLTDSDNDGISDNYEIGDDLRNPRDTDHDGVIDAVDYDDDNDGIVTLAEQADPNNDGDPSDAVDSDNNGVPDYLDFVNKL